MARGSMRTPGQLSLTFLPTTGRLDPQTLLPGEFLSPARPTTSCCGIPPKEKETVEVLHALTPEQPAGREVWWR
jgi:hypothetical protein